MATITHLHSRMRRFLLPIFGVDQAIFCGTLVAVVVVGCLASDPVATPYLVGGALVGMWFVAGLHAPVSAQVSLSSKDAIIETLDAHWRRSGTDRCWVPRVARWRRWGYVQICLQELPGVLIVTGPETNVRPLLARAEAPL